MTTAAAPPPYTTNFAMRRIAAAAIRRLCEIPEQLSVTDFATRHRILPETSTSQGPYDPSIVPYVRRPQDLMGDPSVSMVALCWGSQSTKSTLIENAMMYRICRSPSPMVVVQPKIDAAEAWSKERFRPMIRATPLLRRRIKLGRNSESTLRYFKFPGGFAFIASAQSATELASRSAPFLFLDEVDRMENLAEEGNPVEIVLRRQGAADIGLAVLTSTPRHADTTIIWPYLENGTYELYNVPCPHCDYRQPLVWKNLKWDKGRISQPYYVCAGVNDGGCGATIDESYKREMLAEGQWVATNPEGSYPSFHLNSLYSPFAKSSWGVLAAEWDRAQGKPADLQVFVNTRLAELFEDTKDVTDPNALINRLNDDLLEGIVPAGVAVVTAGVDVQANRVEVYVWGWGAGLESWLVAYAVIPGDPQREPDQPGSVWAKLDEFLARRFAHEHSNGIEFIPITTTFVDSGFAATQVYRYTNQRRGRGIFASKGVGGDGQQLLGKPALQGRERTILYPVGTDAAKNEFIRSQLQEPRPGPGYVHLGGWVSEDQCKQLVAEKRKRKLIKGRVVYEWRKKTEDAPNEALDCRNYARAARESHGTKMLAAAAQFAEGLIAQARAIAASGISPKPAAPAGSGRRMLSRGLPRDS